MADNIPQAILNKASKDKFILVLDIPKILKNSQSSTLRSNTLVNLDKLQFSVVGTLVPKISVPSESLGNYGQVYKVSSFARPEYSPIRVNFAIDNNFDNYWVLWKWLNILNDYKKSGTVPELAKFTTGENTLDSVRKASNEIIGRHGGTNITYKTVNAMNDYTDYQTTVTVFGLREYNEKVVKFEYTNAFITDLGDISYDYKTPEQIDCYFEFVFGQLGVELLDPA